jgi:oligopeptide/dipeptide ABC transporter ATP-binding protein
MMVGASASILEAREIRIGIARAPRLEIVRGVSFALRPGQTLALVGESGSGKSLMALSLLRLLPSPLSILHGTIRFGDIDVTALGTAALRQIRGGGIAMIFQEPLSALNPVMSIGCQLAEAVHAHQRLSRDALRRRVVELLDLVRLPDAVRQIDNFPHRLSGGMRQRVLIAMALAGRPRVLIADEPTTALDATVQKEILDMLSELQREFGLAILLISHDLGLVADYADDVAVMYGGGVIEAGTAAQVLSRPAHPYTQGLLGARPPLRSASMPGAGKRVRLVEIPGTVPDPANPSFGCAFAPRCPRTIESCRASPPPQVLLGDGHVASCIRLGEKA